MRRRFQYFGACAVGQGESIDVLETAIVTSEVQQIMINLSSTPTVVSVFRVTKISNDGHGYILLNYDLGPAGLNTDNFVSNEHFEILDGEQIRIQFPNADDEDVNVEIILEEK